MKIATASGFLLGIVVFALAAWSSAKNPWIFLNWHAALVVIGGTASAAIVSFGFRHLALLARVFWRRFLGGHGGFDPRETIEQIMALSEVHRLRPEALRARVPEIQDPFLKEAIELASGKYLQDEDVVRILATRTQSIYQRYHDDAMKIRALAKFPPAFGLMGAVMGMIGTMSQIGASGAGSTIGQSLALALVGTLYGVALANLCILPLAENFTDAAREVKAKNALITEAMRHLLQKKNPVMMAEELNSYLLARERLDWRTAVRKPRQAA